MTEPDRMPLAILALALVVLTVAGALLWLQLCEPSDGARLAAGPSTWSADGVQVTPLTTWPGGLRPHDLVVAVDGRTMASWAWDLWPPTLSRAAWHVGQPVRYQIVRAGQRRDLAIRLRRFPLGEQLTQAWGSLCVALISLAVAACAMTALCTARYL